MRYRYDRGLHTTDYFYDDLLIEQTKRDKRTQKMRDNDTNERKSIQNRIKELKELGFPKEEALKRLKTEFSESQYMGFFEGWIDNAYKTKRGQKTMRKKIEIDMEQDR